MTVRRTGLRWPRRTAHWLTGCLLVLVVLDMAGGQGLNAHLEKAMELVGQGNLPAAEKEAKLALSDPAARPLAYSTLGAIRVQQKKYAEGEEYLSRAIRLNPRLLGARLNLGHVYALQGKTEQASKIFREALHLDPNNFSARLGLAHAESALGRYGESLEVARPILNKLRGSPEGLLLLATNYLGLQDKPSAAALVPDWKTMREFPQELSVSFAALLIKSELIQEAIEILEEAKKQNSPSYGITLNLAGCYFAMRDWARATANYQLALTFDENCILCYQQIARIAQRQGDLDQALSYLIMAKRRQPENPDILLEFGKVCLEKNLVDDASLALEKAVELRPAHEPSLYVLASARVAKRQYQEARSLLESLLKKRPTDPQLNYALGAVLYLDVKLDEAESYFRKSLTLQPDQLASYYYLGLVEERKGEDEEAVKLFQELLSRYPQHAPTYESLGTVFLKQRRYVEAQQALEKALSLNPESGKAHYQLGILLGRAGNKAASDEHFEMAKKLQAKEREQSFQLNILTPH